MKDTSAIDSLIIDDAPIGIIIADKQGSIIRANKEANTMFDCDVTGKQVEDLIPQPVRKMHVKYREKYMENPTTRKMGPNKKLFGLRNGETFPVRIALQPVRTDDEIYSVAWIIDETKTEQTVNQLHQTLDDVINRLRAEGNI